jgi:expansin (peptidoglycan-binding protein)
VFPHKLPFLQGTLMTMNHHLLNAVGVGHPALTALVETAAAARYAHAGSGEKRGFACKLTGAGGGGCAIILSPVPYCADSTAANEPVESEGGVSAALCGLVEKIRCASAVLLLRGNPSNTVFRHFSLCQVNGLRRPP